MIDKQYVGVISSRKHDRQPTQTYQTVESGPDLGGQLEFRFEVMKCDGDLIDPVQDVTGQSFEKFDLGTLDIDFIKFIRSMRQVSMNVWKVIPSTSMEPTPLRGRGRRL